MRRLRPLWLRDERYFPALEVASWSRLVDARQSHADALAVLREARETGEDELIEDAVLHVCDTVELAAAALAANFAEAVQKLGSATASSAPPPSDGSGTAGATSHEEQNRIAGKLNRERTAEQTRLKDRAAGVKRDRSAVETLRRRILERSVLHGSTITTQVAAELANERERVAQTRARAAETLEDRVDRLEAERGAAA
jgi:hypothetical protein